MYSLLLFSMIPSNLDLFRLAAWLAGWKGETRKEAKAIQAPLQLAMASNLEFLYQSLPRPFLSSHDHKALSSIPSSRMDDTGDWDHTMASIEPELGQPAPAAADVNAPSDDHPQSITDLATPQQSQINLTALPQDILIQIWLLLDKPGPVHASCRTMHDLGHDSYLIRRYFWNKGRGFAIFHLIASNLFTIPLFETLLAKGAILPLCLVQEVVARHFNYGSVRFSFLEDDGDTWSMGLTNKQVLAIVAKGEALYGKDLGLESDSGDTARYFSWVNGRIVLSEASQKQLVSKQQRMPSINPAHPP